MSVAEHKELPLSTLKLSFQPHTATAPAFFAKDNIAVGCRTQRYRAIADIELSLEAAHRSGHEVYLYKLYEQTYACPSDTPDGSLGYTLRFFIQARREPF